MHIVPLTNLRRHSMDNLTFQLQDPVVSNRKIKLVNGAIIPAHTRGIISCLPPNQSVVHVQFDCRETPCLLSKKDVRKEGEPPSSLLKKVGR